MKFVNSAIYDILVLCNCIVSVNSFITDADSLGLFLASFSNVSNFFSYSFWSPSKFFISLFCVFNGILDYLLFLLVYFDLNLGYEFQYFQRLTYQDILNSSYLFL
jgi:hypothetical protein